MLGEKKKIEKLKFQMEGRSRRSLEVAVSFVIGQKGVWRKRRAHI